MEAGASFPTTVAASHTNTAEVTDAVHAKGSFIFLQTFALGAPPTLAHSPPRTPRTPSSPRPQSSFQTAPPLNEYVALFAQAARNAVQAGFDGVEVHGANGYLIDQFIQDTSNVREDEYGGSVENRNRFTLRVVDAVVHAIGADRTDMGMRDPVEQFTHLIAALAQAHTDLAYIHLTEPRVVGNLSRVPHAHESNDVFRAAWAPRRVISAGGYDRTTAIKAVEEHGDLIAFGRDFISNASPDLPKRLQRDILLTPYDRKTFYIPAEDPDTAHGYIDYPFADEGAGW
ncbi:hypothetical protein BD779DRAFT_1671106 [Infundibulicybe gibba]|nr:hypothetical protein BD779DRAFT_1671106 [Infundibulicybe gibba]